MNRFLAEIKERQYPDTLFLRFLAILLITNSHLDKLYPYPALASGGALGNALFFFLSGLGLSLSVRMSLLPTFWQWYRLRLVRIYPSLWFTVIIFAWWLGDSWKAWNWYDYFYQLLYPTRYWFISALLLFHLLLYPLLAKNNARLVFWFMVFLIIPYFIFYYTVLDLSIFSIEKGNLFKWIFYLQVFLFGVWLAPLYKNLKPCRWDWIFWTLTMAIYIGLKWIISQGHLTFFQFLVHGITLPFVYYSLKIARHSRIALLVESRVWGDLIAITGASTLEIYLLQQYIYDSSWIRNLAFPLSIIAFWLATIPIAFLIMRFRSLFRNTKENAG